MSAKSFILVSGGSGGIGSALCRLLPARGYVPIVGYRKNQAKAERVALETGGFALPLDMDNDEAIALALAVLATKLSSDDNLSGIVLAASAPPDLVPFSKLTAEVINNQIRTNVIGPQLLLAGLIKKFFRKTKSGVVLAVLTDAMAGDSKLAASGMGAYIIAKTALRGMLDVCAAENTWLKVRSFSPSFTKTDMLKVFDDRYLEMVEAKKSFASPEEVAELILEEMLR